MRIWRMLFIIVTGLFITSCQKEVSSEGATPAAGGPLPVDSGTNTETGNWKFISLSGTLGTIAESLQFGGAAKMVSSTAFTSQNNGGTITFDNSKMTASGITMSVNTSANTYVYVNGFLVDSVQTPLNQTLPSQNASSDYTKIGADSLHFQDGGFLNALTGGLLPDTPTGCKLKFEGNLMKMLMIFHTVTTQDIQGVPAKVTVHAELLATLRKEQ